MQKTQSFSSKASFKQLLNVEADKIPEKTRNSRSRSRQNRASSFSRTQQTITLQSENNDGTSRLKEDVCEVSRLNCETVSRQEVLKEINSQQGDDRNYATENNLNRKNSIAELRQKSREEKERGKRRNRSVRSKNSSISSKCQKFSSLEKVENQEESHPRSHGREADPMNEVIKLKNQVTVLQSFYGKEPIAGMIGSDQPTKQKQSSHRIDEILSQAHSLQNRLDRFHIENKKEVAAVSREYLSRLEQVEQQRKTFLNRSVLESEAEPKGSIQGLEQNFCPDLFKKIANNESLFGDSQTDLLMTELERRLAMTEKLLR